MAHVTTVDVTLRFLLLPQLSRLREEGFEVTAISAPGPWTAQLEAEGIRHVGWPDATRAWDPGADARAFRSLTRIFRRERFHLVHTHNPKPGVLGRFGARLAGVPCVVNTVHGLYAVPEDPLRRKVPVLSLEWLAARFSDLELYQSDEDLRWARRIGLVPSRKSAYLGNGTDLSWFDPAAVPPDRLSRLRRELDLPDGALVVGTVGRLVAEKGYRELLEAARLVNRQVPEARFLAVAPPDPEKWDAVHRRELHSIRELFRFTGWREDVRDLLALMDVFVLASWREGLPRSAIEAAAMGLPLVVTDVRGCREVVRDGEEGLLVPPRDAATLARAIIRLLGDKDLRGRLGAAARRRAEDRFDQRAVGDRLVTAYRQVLARKGLGLPQQEELDR